MAGTEVLAGPRLCGGATTSSGYGLGLIVDKDGQPAAAYSQNAATGKIIIGEIINHITNTGDVLLCTISGGCGKPLTNSSVTPDSLAAGVAIDKNGNCWESGYAFINSNNVPSLFYWPGCTGDALVAQGVSMESYGGLAIDPSGNIVATDFTSNIYVYSCKYSKITKKKPGEACTLLSTTPMEGESIFFNIGKDGNLVVGDAAQGTVDVYTYSPSGSTYQYSFDSGLIGQDVYGGADSPQAK